jgi:charged multivesicular body protein 2A
MGNKPSFEEKMRENKRRIHRSIREIDRERVKLQNTEKKTIREIKKLAKQNQTPSVKILAKDLVRIRG